MKILFATTNKGKVREARFVLREYGIRVQQARIELQEVKSDLLEEVARQKALQAFSLLKQPVVVDDTGFYLRAFKNFPGAFSKWVVKAIGREGLKKLVEGKNRSAFFKTIVAFADGVSEPRLFKGVENGRVSYATGPLTVPSLPYDPIFVPHGNREVYSRMSLREKLRNNSRAKAFQAFAKWFSRRRWD